MYRIASSSSTASASCSRPGRKSAMVRTASSCRARCPRTRSSSIAATREGAAIVERVPFVDVVFGPQTLHRLPQLLERRGATGAPQVDISFPLIEKFDSLPAPRTQGARAYVSIMEGCSKYCSFCVVPYTRGEEVSRPFADVIAEIAALARQGVSEVTLLGQNVNAWRAKIGEMSDGRDGDFAELLAFV